jgi:hypothetical protein
MRLRPFGLLVSGVVVAASACSGDATAPARSSAPVSAAFSKGHHRPTGSELAQVDQGEGSSTYTVTIDPGKMNVLHFGEHTLYLPQNAICSTASGYGVDLWDSECAPETLPVTITAKVTAVVNGLPRIDLLPDKRFSPRTTVLLSLSVPSGLEGAASNWHILYCPSESTTCEDESLRDPSLATHADVERGILIRRIKHFSGYMVAERGQVGLLY